MMSKSKFDIDKYIEKAAEIYNQNVGLKYAINQIPIAGFFIDQFFTNTGPQIQQRRLMEAIEFLHQFTDKIDKTKVDYDFLESEEFYDLILGTFQNSVKTRHKQRILLNCKILAGTILIENRNIRHSAEDLLALVSDLSPIDLKVASEIYKQQKDKPDKFNNTGDHDNELAFVRKSGWGNLPNLCGLNELDFQLSLHKLSNANLVKQVIGPYPGNMGNDYIITPTYQRLMSIISYSNEPIFINKLD
jgi:hypothetical protein